MKYRRIVVAVATVAAVGATVAVTRPSVAATDPSGGGSAAPASTLAADGLSPQVLSALRRDVGVDSEAAARARLRMQAWAGGVTDELRAATGDAYAGAWLSKDGRRLNVAVTDAGAADEVRAVGATPAVVAHSARELEATKQALDAAAGAADRKLPGWYVDVPGNTVVVLANQGEARQARALIARAGVAAGTATVVTTASTPKPLADIRGGDPYFINVGGGAARCSIGFAVVGGFVTAGHCGAAGATTIGAAERRQQGVVRASVFPGNADMGFVAVQDGSTLRPVVNDFAGRELPVAGNTEAPIGAAVCRSGSTTGTFCGRILAKNQTVNYPEGTVTGLTQTDVCAEGGDSGGPWLAGDQAQGVTSGGSGDCTIGGETFFQPVNEILQTNGLTLLTVGNSGSQPPADQPPADQPPADEPPADQGGPPGSCAELAVTRQGELRAGAAQVQPEGGAFRARAGTHAACLDAADGADFDLYLQQLTDRGFATVARATGAGDEVLTFVGRTATYRYVVDAASGSGPYTLNFDVF
ncbi:MAG TPA: S1 family peptidase [Actinoplanes sp.]|nr:S1 family peptidase [Actinoplanes sp.]